MIRALLRALRTVIDFDLVMPVTAYRNCPTGEPYCGPDCYVRSPRCREHGAMSWDTTVLPDRLPIGWYCRPCRDHEGRTDALL